MWCFDDGDGPQTLNGKLVAHTFNNPGTYVVTLTVEDSFGASNSTLTITVLRAPPTILIDDITAGQLLLIGQPLTFRASINTTATLIQDYQWDMGDGSDPITTGISALTHTYSTVGQYTVTLTIHFTDGTSSNATKSVELADASSPAQSSSPSPVNSQTYGPNSTAPPSNNSSEPAIPPKILGILVAVTVCVLGGAFFWLRKNV